MLFPLLISLLVVATVTLFAIGGLLFRQQRLEYVERRTISDDAATVTLGGVITDTSEIDDQALANLQLELQARQYMADIIG